MSQKRRVFHSMLSLENSEIVDCKIGVVEDDLAEYSMMMTSVNCYCKLVSDASFINYVLRYCDEEKKYKVNFDTKTSLFERIENDIRDNKIQTLIVDYKLEMLKEVVNGMEIVNHFHALLPEFPVVILTKVPDDGRKNPDSDSDKVYSKDDLLIPKEAKTSVENIIFNMLKYYTRRADLELQRKGFLNDYFEQTSEESFNKLINIELELGKMVPIENTLVDKTYDLSKMKEAVELLKELKGLV